MLLKMLKAIISATIGKLSDEDKQKLKGFVDEAIKAAVSGAIQGAIKK